MWLIFYKPKSVECTDDLYLPLLDDLSFCFRIKITILRFSCVGNGKYRSKQRFPSRLSVHYQQVDAQASNIAIRITIHLYKAVFDFSPCHN